jgi:SOS-response transcriptional repressor LexA
VTLTRREAQCLEFITSTVRTTGRAPFKYEIAAHFGAASRGYVYRILASLEAKGFVRRRKYEPRGIEIVVSTDAMAA